ncbi:hypothetical protein BJX62DRAFT_19596 [Aspergillus germanicus]
MPCNNCSRRSVPCKYTREGYSDPYRAFQIAPGPENQDSPASAAQNIDISAGTSVTQAPPTSNVQDTIGRESELPHAPELQELWGHMELSDLTEYTRDLAHPGDWELPEMIQSPEGARATHLDFGLLPSPVQSPPTAVDFQHQQSLLPPIDYVIGTTIGPHCDPEILSYATRTGFLFDIPEGVLGPPPNGFPNGFLTAQIDPVEAKCADIRTIISALGTNDTPICYFTRANLVRLVELYSQYYQPNIPIVHGPTFRLIDEPPVLLLAMMLVGACYSPENTIPSTKVTKLSVMLLGWIDSQPVGFPDPQSV